MHFNLRQPLVFASAVLLATAFAVPQHLTAQATDHLVSPNELQQAVQDSTQARQQNIDTLRDFFSSPNAHKALEQARIDPVQVRNAVAGLNDQELAQLAARATKAQNEFAAGDMSDHDLLLILVVIAAVILIVVVAH